MNKIEFVIVMIIININIRFLLKLVRMIPKAVFELTLKIGKKIPVEVLPHINESIAMKVKESKKFKDYVNRIENA
jgi:hypothetical protein